VPTIKKQSIRKKKKLPKKKGKKKSGSVIDRIAPIGFSEDDGINIVLYGRPGTGKTTLWSTFPKPILALICSGGFRPGELRSIDTPQNRKTIQQVTLQNRAELAELVEYQEETEKFATVVLDHSSGFQDLILKEILDVDEVPAQLSWGIATQQQWGQVALMLKESLRKLLGLQCNVVVISQERAFHADEGADSLLSPYVAPGHSENNARWLCQAVDYVCQTHIRQKMKTKTVRVAGSTQKMQIPTDSVEYCLRTYPSSIYESKFRVPDGSNLPKALVNPTYEKIFKLIQGGS
jgi:hypothetical protein